MLFSKNKYTLKVEGMKCVHCASRVTEALEKVEGVNKVKVDLENKEVIVISKNELDINLLKEAATFDKFSCSEVTKSN